MESENALERLRHILDGVFGGKSSIHFRVFFTPDYSVPNDQGIACSICTRILPFCVEVDLLGVPVEQ